MTTALLVPTGRVRTAMSSPGSLSNVRAKPAPTGTSGTRPGPEERLVESLKAVVEAMDDERAQVLLFEEGGAVPYLMPSDVLRRNKIGEGERFLVDVFECDGVAEARIRRADSKPERKTSGRYLTPEELEAQADEWIS